jgi:hypothetical protein
MAVDGQRSSTGTSNGWSSNDSLTSNHTEWITIDLGATSSISRVDLFPRDDDLGYGFPLDFTIQVSINNTNWSTVITQTGYPLPTVAGAKSFTFASTNARYVKITGTNLRPNPNDNNSYRMQFAEIEIYSSSTVIADGHSLNKPAGFDINNFPNPLTKFDLARLAEKNGLKVYDLTGNPMELNRIQDNGVYFVGTAIQAARKIVVIK